MPVDPQTGLYHSATSPKQDELRRICQQKKFVLANGCRLSTKTVGCLFCVADHAWLTQPANIALITLTQNVGFDSGVWNDLTKTVLPAYMEDNGMEWVEEPYLTVSKKPTCEVTNRFGGITTIQLESCQNEQEAEDRFKPRRYSMIYVPELSTFRKMKTYITWTECLRMIGLASDKHLLLACTNPSDEGEASFIYHLFFNVLDLPEKDVDPAERPLRKHIARVDFTLDDNIFDSQDRKDELKAKYHHDHDLEARYIYGKWTTSSEDALFHEVFREGVHVVGQKETPGNKNPETLVPSDECFELVTGWDPGGRNCAAGIAEKQMVKAKFLWPQLFKSGTIPPIDPDESIGFAGLKSTPPAKVAMSPDKEFPIFKFLDELVLVAEDFRMEDFVEQFVEKMDFWENVMGKKGRVAWRHWSDRSAFEATVPFADRFWYEMIYEISGGRISLMAERGNRGAVSARVDLWRKMLWEQRLWFSAAKCPQLILMNKSIKKGATVGTVIQKGSPWKHSFDWASYLTSSEAYDELAKSIRVNIRKRHENSLVSVSY